MDKRTAKNNFIDAILNGIPEFLDYDQACAFVLTEEQAGHMDLFVALSYELSERAETTEHVDNAKRYLKSLVVEVLEVNVVEADKSHLLAD